MLHNFINADDLTTPFTAPPILESAYEKLLASREILFTTGDVTESTEEDVLCNKNLETSYLFRTLSDKSKLLNKQIENLVENDTTLDETCIKFKSTNLTITNLCMLHSSDSIESLQRKYLELTGDINAIQITIKKEIGQKKEKLETELDSVNMKLNGIRKLIQVGIEDIVKPENLVKKMCPVCYDNEVCMVMIPCGHTYCDGCSKFDYRAKCHQCRATINSRIKIFFSV